MGQGCAKIILKGNLKMDLTKKEKDDIERKANELLQEYGDCTFDPITIAKGLGLQVYHVVFKNPLMEGQISSFNIMTRQREDVPSISVSEMLGKYRFLFVVAHELGHYIFDYKEFPNVDFCRKDNATNEDNHEERRADFFAACILMPRDKFTEVYNSLIKSPARKRIVPIMSMIFECEEKAVKKRLEELELQA